MTVRRVSRSRPALRVLWLATVLVPIVLACGGVNDVMHPLFDRPVRYAVQRGDTLGEIAKDHGVSVGQLRQWNGIEGDLIEVGQVMLIYPGEGGLAAAPRSDGRRSRRRRRGPAEAPVELQTIEVEAGEPSRLAIRIDGMAGILGTKGPSADASGIGEAASRLGHTPGGAPSSGLGARSGGLGEAGTAEALDAEFGRRLQPEPTDDPGSPILDRSLRMPPSKTCLAGPADVEGDKGIAVATGLSSAQLRDGLASVTGSALSCFSGARGSFEVGFSLVVGCDGRMSQVTVTDDGGLPAATVACVQRTLEHAGFDAHARPDGVDAALPLRFEF